MTMSSSAPAIRSAARAAAPNLKRSSCQPRSVRHRLLRNRTRLKCRGGRDRGGWEMRFFRKRRVWLGCCTFKVWSD